MLIINNNNNFIQRTIDNPFICNPIFNYVQTFLSRNIHTKKLTVYSDTKQTRKKNKQINMYCSNDDTMRSTTNQETTSTTTTTSNDNNDGWLKRVFGSNNNESHPKYQQSFIPKNDFNVPNDGLPATPIKSRKSGRTIR